MKPDLKLQKTSHYYEKIRALPELRVSRKLILILLIFWLYIACTIFAEQVVSTVIYLICLAAGKDIMQDADLCLLLPLLLTAVCIALTFVCCRFLENRPVRTMYLTRKKLLPDYLTGALLGFGMMSAVVLAAWGFGALEFEGLQPVRRPLMMVLLSAAWMIQGFSEELTFRGWLMTSLGTHHNIWLAVILSSVNFALLHFSNDGFSVFAVINLILFGLVTALYVLRTGSLWGAAAMHGVWNWAQGTFYGLQVSGIVTGSTVLRFQQTGAAQWIGGGTFGLEAGAGTTVVLLLAAAVLLLSRGRAAEEA